jgi:altronate dehydratase
MLDGIDPTDDLVKYVLRVADGEQTKNEMNGYEEISIFKDGVTL